MTQKSTPLESAKDIILSESTNERMPPSSEIEAGNRISNQLHAEGLHELTSELPPVDDIASCLSSDGKQTRFRYGDCGNSAMTSHLWAAILNLGVDADIRAEVLEAGVNPPGLPGPFSARAGLALMRSGAFHAVSAFAAEEEQRFICGSVLRGGHADRIVAGSVIVEAGAEPRTLSCFAASGNNTHAPSSQLELVPDLVAPPSIRSLARAGNQFDLWTRIARLCQRFAPGDRSLVAATRGGGIPAVVAEELQQRVDAILAEEGTGCVMLFQGNPIAADIFQDRAHFESFCPGIIHGYIIEAMLLADAHDTSGLEVLPPSSPTARKAVAQLLLSGVPRQDGEDGWHTFLSK